MAPVTVTVSTSIHTVCTLALVLLLTGSLPLAVTGDMEPTSSHCTNSSTLNAAACNDPRFVGAKGTRFDFNGLPGGNYCLFTDSSVHINMHMIGYFDERTIGASILDNGKAVRTWIGQLGIMWKAKGESHSLVLSARKGPETERGSGFLASAELDHVALPALQEGETRTLAGGATFTFVGVSSTGVFPLDVYIVTVPRLFTIGISLRVAHSLLRTPTDAMTHINLVFSEMHPTAQVHGVMGQTYRKGHARRGMDYSLLDMLLGRPVAADGPPGTGFLAGKTNDYKTSTVYSTDCRFSAFNDAATM